MQASLSLERRDGLARLAVLEVDGMRYQTPMMIDFLQKERFSFVDSIDFGYAPYALKSIDEVRFEMLRSRDENFTIATVCCRPREIVESLLELRMSSLKPIYAPAIATPMNLPLLVYLGVDIVDNILPIVKGYEGVYMLTDAEFSVDMLKELPCNCPVCSEYGAEMKKLGNEERGKLLARHNTAVLEQQIMLVRELIRQEELRNFVEARVKTNPELTAMLRFADMHDFGSFVPRFKRSMMKPTTSESFTRPELALFFKRSVEIYEPKSKTVVILPCSARKPYMLSKSHRELRRRVSFKGVCEIIVSSPLVSPRELELCYPVMNYDVPVTGQWSGDEVEYVAEKLAALLIRGEFDTVIAHVERGYAKVAERAASIAGADVIFTCEGDILSPSSIEKLKKALDDSPKDSFDLYREIFAHMSRYQFGIGMDGRPRGKYPNLELYAGRERVARTDMRYGMLDIDLPFARRLLEERLYWVEIADFEPKGTIFAAGVVDADENIRPNDVVVFYNSEFYGVGMARMSGREMVEAEKGFAVDVRKKGRL
ncbi:archaeosine synthase subunit alpha [Archaeoglobus veneficus]|uniref:tRNA-guanine transglycosylase, various specificities n=1 Tax=Archaeoglobus veneficus (strain DSM 11195 / SNP6) TaxID=693661 RepID=F2KRL0_ARCVS|nr:archaeosine synthase subunit alpha [Archaeoglobus veneficus]AEA46775.1 tRNA-guanine transglycosylase, various specificities [Archaeoglobus veneficus SNP6]